MRAERPLYDPLDQCIDDLLLTGTWAVPRAEPGNEELISLMQIATVLVELAHRTPPPDERRKRTIWRRLAGTRERWGSAGFLRLATLFGAASGRAPRAQRQGSTTGGCRPLRGVVP